MRARLLVASLRQAELPVVAAALAAALTHDAIAGRTIDMARDELGADVEVLAAAFASNLPEQKRVMLDRWTYDPIFIALAAFFTTCLPGNRLFLIQTLLVK